MVTNKKPARTKSAAKKPSANTPTPLDEDTAAHVIAEYLSIEKVETAEIDAIMNDGHSLSNREIAITFRMSEILKIPDGFAMPPRFQLALARAREWRAMLEAVSAEVQA